MFLTAPTARQWFTLALDQLVEARARVDALNVFPVPDADTGTNVVLTLTAGARRAAGVDDDDVGLLAAAVAEGALRGARGNSGIILAQSLQALARTFRGQRQVDAVLMVRAFDAMAQAAAGAIARPVEGTIVTVARAAADAALALAPPLDLGTVVERAQQAAHDALRHTTDLLPALRGTGQVDAGALVFVMLLDALAQVLQVGVAPERTWFEAAAVGAAPESSNRFEVMYLLTATHREAARLRQRLNTVGDSVVVVGDDAGLWHVHVHVDHPADVLPPRQASQVCVRELIPTRRAVGLVAATAAPGLLEPLARAGAVAVLDPDRAALVRAVQDAATPQVVVLPGSEEIAAAARGAAADPALEGIEVEVASTRSALAVYEAAALLQVAPDLDVAGVLGRAGDLAIARLDGADGAALDDAVDRQAALLGESHPAVVSILVGSAVGAHRAARRLRDLVASACPGVETYVIAGGQRWPVLEVAAQ